MGTILNGKRRNQDGRSPFSWLGWAMAFAALIAATAPSPAKAESSIAGEGVKAEYRGRIIDLSRSWEGASACHVGDAAELGQCFDSESEMDRWLDRQPAATTQRLTQPSAAPMLVSYCSSSLRLYDGTSYAGSSLNLTQRSSWLNLSSYGFDQRTSSFKVGACDSKFADLTNGGGSTYPLSQTEAYDQSKSMNSGWNNDVSSVYIY